MYRLKVIQTTNLSLTTSMCDQLLLVLREIIHVLSKDEKHYNSAHVIRLFLLKYDSPSYFAFQAIFLTSIVNEDYICYCPRSLQKAIQVFSKYKVQLKLALPLKSKFLKHFKYNGLK